VAGAIVPVAGEDFLAGDLGAADAETTSCADFTVWIAQYIFVLQVHRQRN
jgi:hypothetical protein